MSNSRYLLMPCKIMKKTIIQSCVLICAAVLLGGLVGGCSAWSNPHGLLGGLFSSDSDSGQKPVKNEPSKTSHSVQNPKGSGLTSLPPPKFIHVVPFKEGDGFYFQWTRVDQATDYLIYREGTLVADVPKNIYRIHGLLPCRSYQFSIWSSNGVVVSKNPLKVHVSTLGCLRVR
jgi:hypothetical protein